MTFGRLLREKRKALKLTQAQAAQRARICYAQWSSYERDQSEPLVSKALNLLAVLDIEPNELNDCVFKSELARPA